MFQIPIFFFVETPPGGKSIDVNDDMEEGDLGHEIQANKVELNFSVSFYCLTN